MTNTAEDKVAVVDQQVSLIRGGPFYRAQIVARLIKPHQWNLGRRIVFAIAIGWLPLVLLTYKRRSKNRPHDAAGAA